MKNAIGLSAPLASELATGLNHLLANFQLFYINTRGFHWNIQGDNFFELHLKFEEIYTDTQLKIDEVAERILTLGHRPLHSYGAYLEVATIRPLTDVSAGKEALQHVVDAYTILLEQERKLLQMASDALDEGTNALMSDYIRQQEKNVWMFQSYLAQ
jgi:starvation-inducible DNA-binding protein